MLLFFFLAVSSFVVGLRKQDRDNTLIKLDAFAKHPKLRFAQLIYTYLNGRTLGAARRTYL